MGALSAGRRIYGASQLRLGNPKPSFEARFAGETALSSALTFARANAVSTRINTSGLIETIGANTARFNYNLTTLAPVGLLLEAAVQNATLYSEQLGNAVWHPTGITVAAPTLTASDAAAAPDSATTAEEWAFPAIVSAGDGSLVYQTFTSSAATYTGSIYVKAKAAGDVGKRFSIWPNDGVTTTFVHFTLTASWQRVSSTVAMTASGASGMTFGALGSTYGGGAQAAFSCYVWGAQVEISGAPTSYIPAAASAITRSADSCTRTLSTEFNATEGTIVVDGYWPAYVGGNNCIASITDGATTNRLDIYQIAGVAYALARVAGTDQVTLNLGTATALARAKIAFAYKNGSYAACLNGGTVQTSTYAGVPASITTLALGASNNAANWLNSTIRSMQLYRNRIGNSTLQAMTV